MSRLNYTVGGEGDAIVLATRLIQEAISFQVDPRRDGDYEFYVSADIYRRLVAGEGSDDPLPELDDQ